MDGVMLDVFQLECADPEIKVAFVIAHGWTESSGFLHFATASSTDIDSAALRAAQEYISLRRYLNVNMESLLARSANPTECQKDPSLYHLQACFDARNIETFRALVSGEREPSSARPLIPLAWRMTRYESPVRGFKFLRAESAVLQKIEFGIPETSENPPLFHPFW
jgi:hypothetical protein